MNEPPRFDLDARGKKIQAALLRLVPSGEPETKWQSFWKAFFNWWHARVHIARLEKELQRAYATIAAYEKRLGLSQEDL